MYEVPVSRISNHIKKITGVSREAEMKLEKKSRRYQFDEIKRKLTRI